MTNEQGIKILTGVALSIGVVGVLLAMGVAVIGGLILSQAVIEHVLH